MPRPKPEVADAVDDERLLGGVPGRAAAEVVADQEVGAEADRFPEDEEHQQVVCQHQHQHREDEEGEVGEEAVEAAVAVHVADGVDVDEQADRGDDEEHDRGELVGIEGNGDVEFTGRDPGEEPLADRVFVVVDLEKDEDRDNPRAEDGRDRNQVGLVADQRPAQQDVDTERRQWQQRYQEQNSQPSI